MNFEDEGAIITGGTAGIGEATAWRMAELRAMVVFVGRDEQRGEKLKKCCSHAGESRGYCSRLTNVQALLRYSLGATPTMRRKTLLKWL